MNKNEEISIVKIQKWNDLKGHLSIDELLAVGINCWSALWDKNNYVVNDCINMCFEKVNELTPRQLLWLGNMCMYVRDQEKTAELWKLTLSHKDTTPEQALKYFRAMHQRKIYMLHADLQEDWKKLFEDFVGFLSQKEVLEENVLKVIIGEDSGPYPLDATTIKPFYEKIFGCISNDAEKVWNIFVEVAGIERMKEFGMWERVIQIVMADPKTATYRIEFGLQCDVTYKRSFDVFFEKIKKNPSDFKLSHFLYLLDLLKEEDKEKVIRVTPKSFYEASLLMRQFADREEVFQ